MSDFTHGTAAGPCAHPQAASKGTSTGRLGTMAQRTETAAVNAAARADLAALLTARLSAALGTARGVVTRWAPRRDALGRERWPNKHAPDLWAASCVHAGMIRAELARRARPSRETPRPPKEAAARISDVA